MSLDSERVWPVWCTAHRGEPAIALCTECRNFLCPTCKSVGPDGRAFCPTCADELGLVAPERIDKASAAKDDRLFDLVRDAFRSPRAYAQRIEPRGSIRPALFVGMVASVIGALATLLWLVLLVKPPGLATTIRDGAEQFGVSAEDFQLIILAMIPVSALMRLFFGAVLLQLGSALAGATKPLGYKANLRVFCFASVAQFFLVVPFVGIFLALYYVLIICWSVQQTRYRFTNRQTLIAVAPLAIGIILMGMVGAP